MKINFDQQIKDLTGNPIKEEGKEVVLKTVCVNALLASNPKKEISGQEKLDRYELARKVNDGGEVEITSEEIVKIKESVDIYPTIIYGEVCNLLEQK